MTLDSGYVVCDAPFMPIFNDEWRIEFDDWKTTNPADEYLGTGTPSTPSFICRLCGHDVRKPGNGYRTETPMRGLCRHCYGECLMCLKPTIRPEPLCPTCRKIHLKVMP